MRNVTLSALVVIVIDQLSKIFVLQVLNLQELLQVNVLPGFVTFRMAWNDGINFGLLSDQLGQWSRWILIGVALLICVGVWLWMRRDTPRLTTQIAAGLVIGGALGNVIDRLRFGAVADFLNVTCCGIRNPYAFNVADVAIFLGAALLVLLPARKGA